MEDRGMIAAVAAAPVDTIELKFLENEPSGRSICQLLNIHCSSTEAEHIAVNDK